MTWTNLPTNYTDAQYSGLRKYRKIENQDGTISFVDMTEYTQEEHSFYSANDANQTNDAINNIMTGEVFYSKAEVDALLLGKSDISHIHDDRYYTEAEVDLLLSGKANVSHNHDSLYYRKNECNKWGTITGDIEDQTDLIEKISEIPTHALSFYVNASSGSDSNNGDETHPFKSLSKAISSVPEYGIGTIYLKYPTFNFYDEPVISNKQISFICTSNQDLQLSYPIDIVIENSHVEFHGYSTSYDFALYRGLDIKNSEVIIENFRRVYFETFAGVEASAEIKLQSSRFIVECPMYIKEMQEGSHITAVKALDGSIASMDDLTFVPASSTNCTLFHADGSLIFCQSLSDAVFGECITANGGRILWGQQVIGYTDAEIDAMLDNKQDLLTFDTTPTANSANPVTSDGIKSALDAKSDVITASASGTVATFANGVDAPVVDLTASIVPVQSGTGDPSPSNVRPISGWNDAIIQRTGKNLIHCETLQNDRGINVTENANGSITLSGTMSSSGGYSNIMTSQSQPLKKGTYTLSISKPLSYNLNFRFIYSNETDDYSSFAITANKTKVTFTTNRDGIKWRLHISQLTQGQTIDDTFFIQLESGTEATTYEYPNINEYLIPFTETGIVYGGNLNVTTGQLTVNRGIVYLKDLTFTLNANAHIFNSLIEDRRKGATDGFINGKNISDIYIIRTSATDDSGLSGVDYGFAFGSGANNRTIYVKDIRATTVAEAMALFTSENSCIVYELATPVTYQLTPTEVLTILGQNNVWADTGDISLTYFLTGGQGIGTAIDNTIKMSKYDDGKTRTMITQSSETTMTASKNYSTGDLLIANNQLLRATAVIISGTTIVIGTSGNAEVVDLATIIAELNVRISALES